MLELINEKGIPFTDELREIQDWLHDFRARAGVGLSPFVFDPMVEEATDREELEKSGMEEDDIVEMLHHAKNDFHDPKALRSVLENVLEYARGLPAAKEAKLLVKELKQLLEGCDAAIRVGDKVQLLADFEDRDDPDYDDEEGDEEAEEDEDER
jgi:hypothetical protein